MNKQILKWVLSQLDETELLNLVIMTMVKIDGFREITKNNIKTVKPQILNALQMPSKIKKVKIGLGQYIKKVLSDEDITNLREKNQNELIDLIAANTYNLADVLIVILTGEEDATQVELAEKLFTEFSIPRQSHEIYETNEEANLDKIEMLNQTPRINEVEKKLQKLEEQLIKDKEKSIALQTTVDDLRAKRKAESQEWRKDRKVYNDKIQQLESTIELQYKKIESLNNLTNELSHKIQSLNQLNNILVAKIESNQTFMAARQEQTEQLHLAQKLDKKDKVIILAESIPASILNNSKLYIESISNNQLEDFLKQDFREKEIWMLSFHFSPQKQRRIRNTVGQNNITEFANILELQTHISKR